MTKVLAKYGILAVGILLLPSVASAQYMEKAAWRIDDFGGIAGQLWQFHPAYGGPQQEEGGAGSEQAVCAYRMSATDTVQVGCIYMSSNLLDDGDRPWQCKMSVFELNSTRGISVLHDQVQVTTGRGNGDRPCGHPGIMTDGDYWYISYGRDATNGNTQPYLEVRDVVTLDRIGNRLNLTTNNNNNVGAPRQVDAGTLADGKRLISSCFYDNDANRTYCRAQTFDGATLANLNAQTSVVAPADIGRPSLTRVATTSPSILVCAAQGDNRPPEDGIRCVHLDVETNTKLWEGLVYDADPANNMYWNMPYIADLGDGSFVISAQRSNGMGKNNNNKGAAVLDLQVLRYDGTTWNMMTRANDVSALATHASVTAVTSTIDGITTTRAAVLGSPITGSGPARLTFMGYDGLMDSLSYASSRVAHAYNADAGKISNIYGENPNNQGRDFHTLIAGVPNPGYGIVGGFYTTVKSWMVITTHGRSAGEPKNGGYIRFLPAETDGQSIDDDCVINPQSCEQAPPDDVDDVDGDGDNPSPGSWDKGGNPGLFGCSVGHHGRVPGGLVLALLGLALFVTLRRR